MPLELTGLSFYFLSKGWVDPKNNDLPIHYFGDEWLGNYSVQFTATNEDTCGGIEGIKKYYFQGLCFPQYVFYCKGYNILLNAWRTCPPWSL